MHSSNARFVPLVALLGLITGCPESADEADDDSADNPIAADSAAEFSAVQGLDGWEYGYWDQTADEATGDGIYAASEFQQMTYWYEDWYVWMVAEGVGGYWTMVGAEDMHPNGLITSEERQSVRHWAIRRWTSDVSQDIAVHGEFYKLALEDDGVGIGIFVDGEEQYFSHLAGTDGIGVDVDFCVPVEIGTPVDFVVTDGENGNDWNDHTHQAATIELRPDGC